MKAARRFAFSSHGFSDDFQLPIGNLPSEEEYETAKSSLHSGLVQKVYKQHGLAISFAEVVAGLPNDKPVSNVELIDGIQQNRKTLPIEDGFMLKALKDRQSQRSREASVRSSRAGSSRVSLASTAVEHDVHPRDQTDPWESTTTLVQ